MKVIKLFFLFIISIFPICSDDKITYINNQKYGKIKVVTPFYNSRINGTIKHYYQSGELFAKVRFVDDIVYKDIIFYAKNGDEFSPKYNDIKIKYQEKLYHDNGTLKRIDPHVNGKRHGLLKGYYRNGKISSVIPFKHGKFDGITKYYYKDGSISKIGIGKNGKNINTKYFYPDGSLKEQEIFKNGELLKIIQYKDGKIIKTNNY